MKKLKQMIVVAVLALCCSMIVKADAKATQITGVKQVKSYSSSVNISCNAIPGIKYYVVQLSIDNSNWTIEKSSMTPGFAVYDLNAGQTYYARVFGSSGYEYKDGVRIWEISTAYSDSIQVVTAPDTVMRNITAVQTDAGTNTVSVHISPVPGANYYILTLGDQIVGQGASSTVTTQNLLDPGDGCYLYAYPCRRSNIGYIARGSYGDGVYVKTLAPRMKKSDFYMDTNRGSKYYYYINVSDEFLNYDVDGYSYEFQTASGRIKKIDNTFHQQLVGKALESRFYKYRVRTYVNLKDNGKRIYSAWSNYRTCGRPKVKSIYAVKKGKKIQLYWGRVTGASGFEIYTSNKKYSGYKKVKSLGVKKRSITISKVKGKKLKKNKTYYFRIVAKSKKQGKSDDYVLYYCKFK